MIKTHLRPTSVSRWCRRMATVRRSLPHEERTAAEPRADGLEQVRISYIEDVNESVRVVRLTPLDNKRHIKFRAGQWLDTFIPGLEKAGGFTITSSPRVSVPSVIKDPYLELAVQKSSNPPAQWLWRPAEEIHGKSITVRVGGSFVWPPKLFRVDRVVLVAGGVGINPLISMFDRLVMLPRFLRPPEVHFVYGTKAGADFQPKKILYVPRLMRLVAAAVDPNVTLRLFLTSSAGYGGVIVQDAARNGQLPEHSFARRISHEDLLAAIDGYKQDLSEAERDAQRKMTLCYVCGPPPMTEGFVDFLRNQPGMAENRVLYEKWW